MLHKGHHYLHFSGWKYKGSEGWYDAFKTTKLRWGRSGVKPRCVNSKDHFLSIIHVSFLPVKINEKFSNAIWNLLLNMKLLPLKLYTLLFTLMFLLLTCSALERGSQKQHSPNSLSPLILGYSCQCGTFGVRARGWEMEGSHCCLEAGTGRHTWTYRQLPGYGS